MRYVVFWRHHPGGSIGDPSVPSLRDQQCGSCSWPTHVPTEKREHVMRVWIHCDEGVNGAWMRNGVWRAVLIYCMMSGVLRWVYICETIMPICVINISPPNDSSCPEKSYVLGYKICQFFVLWVGGLQGHMSALLLTGCSPSLILSLPSAIITIFLSVALIYVSSVLPI